MNSFLKQCGKLLYILAFSFFLSGVASFFYEEVEANTLEAKESIAFQNGYTQGINRGFGGGAFGFTLLKHSYVIGADVTFKGYWLKFGVNSKIKYFIILYFQQSQ